LKRFDNSLEEDAIEFKDTIFNRNGNLDFSNLKLIDEYDLIGNYVFVLDDKGKFIFKFGGLNIGEKIKNKFLKNKKIRIENLRFNKKPVRLISLPFKVNNKNYLILFAKPISDLNESLKILFFIIFSTIPIGILIAIFTGWLLSFKILKPIRDINETAKRITAENLNQRIKVDNPDDELGKLKMTINDMIERLQGSFNRIKQFTQDASHELRMPLTVIRSIGEVTLRHDREKKEYKETLESILEEVEELTKLVDDLLFLSRADFKKAKLNLEEVKLDEILKELTEQFKLIAKEKNLNLEFSNSYPVKIKADGAKLRQLFINLLDNAIKYTPSGGKIDVYFEKDDKNIVIAIKDTGIGIPEDKIGKIFDRFYQVDKSRSENKGSGLGLSIAKWIVEAHKGRIEVESIPGKGSIFTVLLPL
jgi:heavy metal sensor kinase